jgi:hypothetical protein
VGRSRAAVCDYCHALVARKGQDFEAVGKVADLIPTGSRLEKGMTGKFGSHPFQIAGRLQYEWAQGAWDEWYVALDDGRWGWLAEAQGRYYFSFPDKLPEVPPFEALIPGASFSNPHGEFALSDKKRARIAGVEGEVPDAIRVGDEAVTADFDGPKGLFATVDYSDETPHFFIGRQVTLEQLHLSEAAAALKGRAKAGGELKCPNCGAPVELRVPDQTVRAVCEACGALLDTSKGNLQVLEVLEKHRTVPPIPLGTQGVLRGRKLMVVGFMRRSCMVEGETYYWEELLLYEPSTTGFVWLVRSDGHWQLAEPIPVSEVGDFGSSATYKGRRFKLFSNVWGGVEQVLGEFYWAVRNGDSAELSDYTSPPHGLSCERTDDELNWTHLTHLDAAELATAFNKPGLKAEPATGVGTIQPYPYEKQASSVYRWCGLGVVGLVAIWLAMAVQGKKLVYEHRFSQSELLAGAPQTAPTPSGHSPLDAPGNPYGRAMAQASTVHNHSFLSEPFSLPAHRAVEVLFSANVDNHWAYADGALVPAKGGSSQLFGLEASYYHGYDGGESWSEGNRNVTTSLTAQPTGDYVVRADLQWDPKLPAPPPMLLRVYAGGTSGWQFVFALLALGGPIILLVAHRAAFEKQRWENSTVGGN